MKQRIIRLGITSVSIFYLPLAFSGTLPHCTDPVSDLVQGLQISTCKMGRQPNTLVVRIKNNTTQTVKVSPDAVIHPNVMILVASPDGNSEEVYSVSHEMPGTEDINGIGREKQVKSLAPGGEIEISLKIADLINRYDSGDKAQISNAAGRVKIGLSFDHLIVGVDGDDNPTRAFNTTFNLLPSDLPR